MSLQLSNFEHMWYTFGDTQFGRNINVVQFVLLTLDLSSQAAAELVEFLGQED